LNIGKYLEWIKGSNGSAPILCGSALQASGLAKPAHLGKFPSPCMPGCRSDRLVAPLAITVEQKTDVHRPGFVLHPRVTPLRALSLCALIPSQNYSTRSRPFSPPRSLPPLPPHTCHRCDDEPDVAPPQAPMSMSSCTHATRARH
jgi:hypothetical protein